MGFSTPKKPFDLKEFLSQTAPRRPGLRWKGARSASTSPSAADAAPDNGQVDSEEKSTVGNPDGPTRSNPLPG
jgi:hypothetical protein